MKEPIKEDLIKCKRCNSSLALILVSETNENREIKGLKSVKTRYIISNCYTCGDSSNLSDLYEGTVSVCPAKDYINLEYIDIEYKGDEMITKLKTTFKVGKK